MLLSFNPTPEAHSEADQAGYGCSSHEPASGHLAAIGTDDNTVLGVATPEPEGNALPEKEGEHRAPAGKPRPRPLPCITSAFAAQVDRNENAKSDDLPQQPADQQFEGLPHAGASHAHPAPKQPEASPPAHLVHDSMATACDSMPPTEDVSWHQETCAGTAVSSAAPNPPGDQPVPEQSALANSRSTLEAASGQQVQERPPSLQAALNSPAQEACTDAQQLADDTGTTGSAGHSHHELADSQAVQDTNATILATKAVLPAEGTGPDPEHLAADALMADDVPMTDDTPVVHDTPMSDDTPTRGNAPTFGLTAGSSKADTEMHHEDVVMLPLPEALHKQKAHTEPPQAPDGTASMEQGSDSSQPGHRSAAVPSLPFNGNLPASASRDTAGYMLTRMSQTPGDSSIIPDSEEPDCNVDRVVAGQVECKVDHTMLDPGHGHAADLHSDQQAPPSTDQQHGAVEDQRLTVRVGGGGSMAILEQTAQGDLHNL